MRRDDNYSHGQHANEGGSMPDFKPFLVIGLALGGVFAMSGVGLVVLYQDHRRPQPLLRRGRRLSALDRRGRSPTTGAGTGGWPT